MQRYVGCSGWSYSAWQGPFYPTNIENSQWLRYYSQVFDYVEIDSTFYRMPNPFMVKNWHKRTPENFRFTAKFPKIITHDKRLKNVELAHSCVHDDGPHSIKVCVVKKDNDPKVFAAVKQLAEA